MAVWLDPVDQHGFPGRYAHVNRYIGRGRCLLPLEPVRLDYDCVLSGWIRQKGIVPWVSPNTETQPPRNT